MILFRKLTLFYCILRSRSRNMAPIGIPKYAKGNCYALGTHVKYDSRVKRIAKKAELHFPL